MSSELVNWMESLLETRNRIQELLEDGQKMLDRSLTKEIDPSGEHRMLLEQMTEQSARVEEYMNRPPRPSEMPVPVEWGVLYPSRQGDWELQLLRLSWETEGLRKRPGVLFTMDGLDQERGFIQGCLVHGSEAKAAVTAIPAVIYNLAHYSKPGSLRAMRHLRIRSGTEVVNPVNGFHQDVLMEMLAAKPGAGDHLLERVPWDGRIGERLHRHNAPVYLLPVRSRSRTEAIVLTKESGGLAGIRVGQSETVVESGDLYGTVRKMIRNRPHMACLGIAPVSRNGLPVECRTYVQKDRGGTWSVTAVVGKHELFAAGSIYKHETYGWTDIEEAAGVSAAESAKEHLRRLPADWAAYLDYYIPNAGSYSMDWLLESGSGKPYLLHAGGADPSRYMKRTEVGAADWERYLLKLLGYLEYRVEAGRQTGIDHDAVD